MTHSAPSRFASKQSRRVFCAGAQCLGAQLRLQVDGPGPGDYHQHTSLLKTTESLSKKGYGSGFVSKVSRWCRVVAHWRVCCALDVVDAVSAREARSRSRTVRGGDAAGLDGRARQKSRRDQLCVRVAHIETHRRFDAQAATAWTRTLRGKRGAAFD